MYLHPVRKEKVQRNFEFLLDFRLLKHVSYLAYCFTEKPVFFVDTVFHIMFLLFKNIPNKLAVVVITDVFVCVIHGRVIILKKFWWISPFHHLDLGRADYSCEKYCR